MKLNWKGKLIKFNLIKITLERSYIQERIQQKRNFIPKSINEGS